MARDWWTIIDEAIETGDGFSHEDVGAAGDWPDCACGIQDRRIPRYTKRDWEHYVQDPTRFPACAIGQPKDAELYELGVKFADAVEDNEAHLAGYLLAKIDRRSGQILAEQARRARAKARRARKAGK